MSVTTVGEHAKRAVDVRNGRTRGGSSRLRDHEGSWLEGPSRAVHGLLSSPKAFRRLMFGSSISMLGTRISTVAFPMLVLGMNHSPLVAGVVAFFTIVPGVLLYLPAGVIVDRLNPRRVMLLSETSRGLVAILVVVALVIFGRHVYIAFLMGAMFLEEVLEIFSTLADRRYLNRLMERDKMSSQQASVEARTHAATLAGRPVGPFLFTLEPFLPFLVDVVSFAVSVVSMLLIARTDETQKAEWPTFKEAASGISQGIGTVKSDRRVWLTSVLMAMTSMVSQALMLIFLFEAHSRQFSALAIGLVLGASGIGGALGSLCAKKVPGKIRKYWIPIQMISWCGVFLMLALAGGRSAWWSGVTMFVLSITGAIGNVEFGTYLASNIADDMIGKVSGIGYTMSIGACALGPVIGGYAVERLHVQGAVLVLLGILSLMALASILTLRESPRLVGARPEIMRATADSHSGQAHESTDSRPHVDATLGAMPDRVQSGGSGVRGRGSRAALRD